VLGSLTTTHQIFRASYVVIAYQMERDACYFLKRIEVIFVKKYADDVRGSTRLFPHGIWKKGFFIFSKTIAREDTEVNFVKTGMYVSDVPQIVSFPMEFGSKLFYFL
jgi:hypothetical protein